MNDTDVSEEHATGREPEILDRFPELTVEAETQQLPEAHFDHWREQAGLVGVGTTTEDGAVLLWDGPHGWTLPYAEVDADGDFAAVAREAIEALTGATPTLVGVERATRMTYHLAGGDDSLTRHQIVFRTDSVDAETAAEMVAETQAVRWVSDVEAVEIAGENEADVEDEVADVRRFLG